MKNKIGEGMVEDDKINKIRSEIQEGLSFLKCKKCGCMKGALENLRSSLSLFQAEDSPDLLKNIESWLVQMEQIKYTCLGCEYCFPAEAMNIFNQVFPEADETQSLTCTFEVKEQAWPTVPGEYIVLCKDQSCPVAVSTLASVELAQSLADARPGELCIVGKTETENIGVDKIIKNTITNPIIRFLLVVGRDPKGHYSGKTLLALWENGVDEHMRVIGSPGMRPVLRNVSRQEVEAFRKQVRVVDMIGCEDVERIAQKLRELTVESPSCNCKECTESVKPIEFSTVPVIQAKETAKIEMDVMGYFVIIPQPEKGIITVEHYSYDNRLLRIIEGKDTKSISHTIIENGWVTQLSHAAYLGKELAKAEMSIKSKLKYVQEGA